MTIHKEYTVTIQKEYRVTIQMEYRVHRAVVPADVVLGRKPR